MRCSRYFPLEYETVNIVQVNDHRDLSHRNDPDAHDVSSITGLQEILDNKLDNTALQDEPVGNILVVSSLGNVESSEYCCADLATKEEVNNIVQDKHFVHRQSTPIATWIINHNLNKFPSVNVNDSAGNNVIGEVSYIDVNNISISFSGAFSGICYCN